MKRTTRTRTAPRPKAELYIGMQPDEDVAEATCGCTLYRTGEDAPEGGCNDDPLLMMCPLHLAAEEMRGLLRTLLDMPTPFARTRARQLVAELEGRS